MRFPLYATASVLALTLALPAFAQDTQTEPAYQTPGAPGIALDRESGADETGAPLGSDRQFSPYATSYGEDHGSFAGTIVGGYTAEELIGKSIVNTEGDEIAEVDDLLIGPDDNVQYVLADVGGFLGLGSQNVAVDLARLQPAQGSGEELVTDLSEDELRAMPSYSEMDGNWVRAE